jgi:hypothetical protein
MIPTVGAKFFIDRSNLHMRFCISVLVFAWSPVATGFKFPKWKPKTRLTAESSPERIDLDRLDPRCDSIEHKVESVGNEVQKVSFGMARISDDAQIVVSSMGNLNKEVMGLGEIIRIVNTESSSTNMQVLEVRKWHEAFDKEQSRFKQEINQKLDTLSRNLESLSESVARVHHLLAIRSMTGVTVPAQAGPPPPPPLPTSFQPLAPVVEKASASPARPIKVQNGIGFGAVLDEIKRVSPLTRLKKTKSKFSVPSSDSSASNTDSETVTDSD